MLYNLTDVTGPVSLLTEMNQKLLGGNMALPIIVVIFFIVFMQLSARGYKTPEIFLTSMFVATMSGFFFYLIGLLGVTYFAGSISILILSVMIQWKQGGQ